MAPTSNPAVRRSSMMCFRTWTRPLDTELTKTRITTFPFEERRLAAAECCGCTVYPVQGSRRRCSLAPASVPDQLADSGVRAGLRVGEDAGLCPPRLPGAPKQEF